MKTLWLPLLAVSVLAGDLCTDCPSEVKRSAEVAMDAIDEFKTSAFLGCDNEITKLQCKQIFSDIAQFARESVKELFPTEDVTTKGRAKIEVACRWFLGLCHRRDSNRKMVIEFECNLCKSMAESTLSVALKE